MAANRNPTAIAPVRVSARPHRPSENYATGMAAQKRPDSPEPAQLAFKATSNARQKAAKNAGTPTATNAPRRTAVKKGIEMAANGVHVPTTSSTYSGQSTEVITASFVNNHINSDPPCALGEVTNSDAQEWNTQGSANQQHSAQAQYAQPVLGNRLNVNSFYGRSAAQPAAKYSLPAQGLAPNVGWHQDEASEHQNKGAGYMYPPQHNRPLAAHSSQYQLEPFVPMEPNPSSDTYYSSSNGNYDAEHSTAPFTNEPEDNLPSQGYHSGAAYHFDTFDNYNHTDTRSSSSSHQDEAFTISQGLQVTAELEYVGEDDNIFGDDDEADREPANNGQLTDHNGKRIAVDNLPVAAKKVKSVSVESESAPHRNTVDKERTRKADQEARVAASYQEAGGSSSTTEPAQWEVMVGTGDRDRPKVGDLGIHAATTREILGIGWTAMMQTPPGFQPDDPSDPITMTTDFDSVDFWGYSLHFKTLSSELIGGRRYCPVIRKTIDAWSAGIIASAALAKSQVETISSLGLPEVPTDESVVDAMRMCNGMEPVFGTDGRISLSKGETPAASEWLCGENMIRVATELAAILSICTRGHVVWPKPGDRTSSGMAMGFNLYSLAWAAIYNALQRHIFAPKANKSNTGVKVNFDSTHYAQARSCARTTMFQISCGKSFGNQLDALWVSVRSEVQKSAGKCRRSRREEAVRKAVAGGELEIIVAITMD